MLLVGVNYLLWRLAGLGLMAGFGALIVFSI